MQAMQTADLMTAPFIVAVLPTYNPEIRLFGEVIESVLKETPSVIVVDNGSEEIEEIKKIAHKITLISLKSNTGQAHALNVGVKEALRSNPEWVLITRPGHSSGGQCYLLFRRLT